MVGGLGHVHSAYPQAAVWGVSPSYGLIVLGALMSTLSAWGSIRSIGRPRVAGLIAALFLLVHVTNPQVGLRTARATNMFSNCAPRAPATITSLFRAPTSSAIKTTWPSSCPRIMRTFKN